MHLKNARVIIHYYGCIQSLIDKVTLKLCFIIPSSTLA